MRAQSLATVVAVSLLLLAAPGGAMTLFLRDGSRLDAKEFRVKDGVLQVVSETTGQVRDVPDDSVDYRATWLNDQSEQGASSSASGVFLGRGKYLEFKSMKLDGDRVRFEFSDNAEMTVPLDALDFRTAVLEARGLAAGGLSSGPAPAAAPAGRTPGTAGRYGASRPGAGPGARPQYRPPVQAAPAADEEDHSGEAEDDDDPGIAPPEPPIEAPPLGPEGEPVLPEGMPSPVPGPNEMDPGQGGDRSDPGSIRHRITRAEPVNRVEPVYDPAAVPAGPGLNALLEVTVGADGTVRNVKVIKSTGIPALDQAAVEAVQQWVYKPAERDGVPYESRRLERITFRPSLPSTG